MKDKASAGAIAARKVFNAVGAPAAAVGAAAGAGVAATGVGIAAAMSVTLFVGMCAAHVFGRWTDHHRGDFEDYKTNHSQMAEDFQDYKFCPVLSMIKNCWLFDKMMDKWAGTYGEYGIVEQFKKSYCFTASCHTHAAPLLDVLTTGPREPTAQ